MTYLKHERNGSQIAITLFELDHPYLWSFRCWFVNVKVGLGFSKNKNNVERQNLRQLSELIFRLIAPYQEGEGGLLKGEEVLSKKKNCFILPETQHYNE